jgi:7-cyano-7-deazaguanine synthase
MGDAGLSKPKAVCLCSGGMDSTVAAAIAKRDGFEIYLFHVSYGQKAEKQELHAIANLADLLDAAEVKSVRTDLFEGMSALTSPKDQIPLGDDVNLEPSSTPPTWVQCRNLVFLSLASAYAEWLGAERIYTGFNAEEARSYPDNRPEFVDGFNATLKRAVASFSKPPYVKAPLIHLQKPDIVRRGVELDVPLELTWSCYQNGKIHCGACEACQHRMRGFQEAGVVDPTLYE